MRAVYAMLLFAFFCSFCPARAAVILSGSVLSFSGPDVTPCRASGTSSSSLSLNCGELSDSSTQATVTGTADQYRGSLYVNAAGDNNPRFSATAIEQVDVSGIYEVTGGVGPATLTFQVEAPYFENGDQGTLSCTFTFNGTSQTCSGFAPLTFTTEYAVPLSIEFQIDRVAGADFDEATGGATVTYSLSGPGLSFMPEPSSILLLLSGFVGILLATRLRVTCR